MVGKEEFYSNSYVKDITYKNYMHYMHAKRVLCLKNDALLLNYVFENFREISLKTYHVAPGLAWQAAFKKSQVLLIDIDLLLIAEKWIKRGIC